MPTANFLECSEYCSNQNNVRASGDSSDSPSHHSIKDPATLAPAETNALNTTPTTYATNAWSSNNNSTLSRLLGVVPAPECAIWLRHEALLHADLQECVGVEYVSAGGGGGGNAAAAQSQCNLLGGADSEYSPRGGVGAPLAVKSCVKVGLSQAASPFCYRWMKLIGLRVESFVTL